MGSEPNRMTLDEVVSYNLRRARELRDWTQAEAADAVSLHLGKTWSQQVYGDAERAHRTPNRNKVFSADEMLALAQAFRLPITWFYQPPNEATQVAPRDSDHPISGDKLLELLGPPALDDYKLARDLAVVAARSGMPDDGVIGRVLSSPWFTVKDKLYVAAEYNAKVNVERRQTARDELKASFGDE